MNARQPLLILAAAWTLFAQGDVTLQRAIRTETLEGNLKGAIALYQKAIAEAKNDRPTAARAWLRMAECQEKLGQAEARKSYERVVKDFADQKDAVQVARMKLGTGSDTTPGPRTRLLWDEARDFTGTVTADGRLVSFLDRMTHEIGIRNLVTGEVRMVSNKSAGGKDRKGTGETSSISPDGKLVAYVWDAWDEDSVRQKLFFHLRVVNADGTNERTLRKAQEYIEVSAWSPDGRWIAASVDDGGKNNAASEQVILFNAITGEERVLPTPSRSNKRTIRFSPDGKWIIYDNSGERNKTPAVQVLATDGSFTAEIEVARDGRAIGWSSDGKHILFARDRQGSSALYAVPFAGGRLTAPEQQIYSASNIGNSLGLTSNGSLIHRLNNRQIDAWIARLDSRTGQFTQTLAKFPGENVRSNMNDNGLKFSSDGRQVAWFEPPNRIRFRSVAGEQERSIIAKVSVIQRMEWAPDGNSIFISGAGEDGQRGLYLVDAATGQSKLISAKVTGAFQPFAVSRDGKTIYYRTEDGKISALSVESGEEKIIHEDFAQVPNLVVSPEGGRLAIRSGGKLGVLDLASGQYKRLYTRDFATDHNVMWGLAWSEDGKRIMVIARDYRTAVCQLWIYPTEGGEPVRQPLNGDMRGLSVSSNGLVATVRGESHPQVLALENFLPTPSTAK